MSKIDRLLAKGKKITFQTDDGDVSFLIRPLKNKEILEVMDLEKKGDTKLALSKLIYYSLVKDDPTITEEQINELPYLMDFVNVIMDVNHLEKKEMGFQKEEGSSLQENSSPPGRVDLRKIDS